MAHRDQQRGRDPYVGDVEVSTKADDRKRLSGGKD